MTGVLNHSPGDIIRHMIIDLGHGTEPEDSLEWPVYVGMRPDSPDKLAVVNDTEGTLQGRSMIDGEMQEKYGIQIVCRAKSTGDAYLKAKQISRALDVNVNRLDVHIGSNLYRVHAFTRTSPEIYMGIEGETRRYLWSVNGVVSISEQPGTGS